MSHRLILASASQIRRQIMQRAGLLFDVIIRPIDEQAIKTAMISDNVPMSDIAQALAETKSIRVSQTESGLVIGSDQIMVMDGQLFDKPESLDIARERLLSMRGKFHDLIGSIVISENGQPVWRHKSISRLYVREFGEDFLEAYLQAEGDAVLTTVGAYKFEGRGAQLFTHVEGDFFSILGLSLLPLLDYLRQREVIIS